MDERRPLTFAATREDQSRDRVHRRRGGFSLVEVMLAMTVLGTSSLAALAALLFSYRTADSNLRAQTALANARAVAEQVLTLDQGRLGAATLPVDVPSSSTGALTVDAWNARTDDLHGTPGNPADDLLMEIRPEVVQPDAASGLGCAQVILRFRWQESSFFAPRTREDALTLVVSDVAAN